MRGADGAWSRGAGFHAEGAWMEFFSAAPLATSEYFAGQTCEKITFIQGCASYAFVISNSRIRALQKLAALQRAQPFCHAGRPSPTPGVFK
jgi:hypothetical protein